MILTIDADVIHIPPGDYEAGNGLIIDRPCTVFAHGVHLWQDNQSLPGVMVRSDDVSIYGLSIHGEYAGKNRANAHGIHAKGVSGLHLEDVSIWRFGSRGVLMEHVDRFTLRGVTCENCHYAGIQGLSVRDGLITGCRIQDIHWKQSYGISLTRQESSDLEAHPRSSNVIVSGNLIRGVRHWHGLDTHGGENISFLGNHVLDCSWAVNVGPCDGDSDEERFAPLNVTVQGNLIDSCVTDGSRKNGIAFTGANGKQGETIEAGTGSIVGNVVRGHGLKSYSLSAGIAFWNTDGLVVQGNSIHDSGQHGVLVYHDNRDFLCSGNSILGSAGNAIRVASRRNRGAMLGNQWDKGGVRISVPKENEIRGD